MRRELLLDAREPSRRVEVRRVALDVILRLAQVGREHVVRHHAHRRRRADRRHAVV